MERGKQRLGRWSGKEGIDRHLPANIKRIILSILPGLLCATLILSMTRDFVPVS